MKEKKKKKDVKYSKLVRNLPDSSHGTTRKEPNCEQTRKRREGGGKKQF